MEQRRRRAGRLFAAGKMTQAAIARGLKVSRQSVSRWQAAWKRRGSDALRGAGQAGCKPRLEDSQLGRVDRALRQGARAHGFGTDLWTLPRVAAVIEQLTGVHYHPRHVWKILGAMNWSPQRPAKQAKERNERARQQWLAERRPAVKNAARRRKAWIVFQDETRRIESGTPQRPGTGSSVWQPAVSLPAARGFLFLTILSLC